MVLLGDAGYAPGPGGMGTGLALIGAYVLAGELARAADHHTAFARYEETLRPHVEACQKQARGAGKYLVPQKRSQIWRRNQMMRLLSRSPGKSLINRLTAPKPIALKHYSAPPDHRGPAPAPRRSGTAARPGAPR